MAPATYDALTQALGPQGLQPLKDYLRQSVLRTGDDGSLAASGSQLRAFLDGPLGSKVFSPEEASEARLLAAGQDVLDAKPLPGDQGLAGSMAKRLVGPALGAVAGAVGGHLVMPGMLGEGAGSLLGGLAEQGLEHVNSARLAADESRGAPAKAAWLDVPQDIASAVGEGARAVPLVGQRQDVTPRDYKPVMASDVERAPEIPRDISASEPPTSESRKPAPATADDPWAAYSTTPPTDNPGFASGGAIEGVHTLVERLLRLTREAQRADKKSTEPLLKVPDKVIVKALDVAKAAI
jgi:hypothetical protein